MSYLLEALIKKLEGEIEVAKANIMVYQRNAAGIGEHPDIVAAVDSELVKLSTAEDKLTSLKNNYPGQNISQAEYLMEGENYDLNLEVGPTD